MTPLQLGMLLEAYIGTRTEQELAPTDTHRAQLRDLRVVDLVELGMQGFVRVTGKGRAFIEHVLNTPLPVRAWVFPNEAQS